MHLRHVFTPLVELEYTNVLVGGFEYRVCFCNFQASIERRKSDAESRSMADRKKVGFLNINYCCISLALTCSSCKC